MRRLLASVAVLAAAMVGPSTALATTSPALAGPASTVNAATATVDLSWNDIRPLPILLSATYQVSRAPVSCATANPSDFQTVGPLQTDAFSYGDPRPADGAYCYFVQADDGSGPANSNMVDVTVDATPPVVIAPPAVGIGCSQLTVSATATDSSPVTMTVNDAPYTQGAAFFPSGDPYTLVDTKFVATDAANNVSLPAVVSGYIWDQTRPPAPVLEVDTDPDQQRATLNWQPVVSAGAQVLSYSVHTRGPQGSSDLGPLTTTSVVVAIADVDATYEYTLSASDVCGPGPTSVRLVRLNDATPPTMPIVAGPSFNPATRVLTLSWVASTDNVQVDHYEILRNGVPLGATDSTSFTDLAPPQHANLSYVVQAVDTNGNTTDSAPAPYSTPDWTPPTAPVPTIEVKGTTVTVRWSAAADNVGVVGYDVLRDGKVKGSMTAAMRTFSDLNVPPGVHTWTVRSRDDAGLSAVSAPLTAKIVKPRSSASVVSLKMVGATHGGAARYSLTGPARLLLDLRVIGTLPKAVLRVYVQNGKGRITVWRGVPGSSTPRQRLHSALVRHGYVTIHLGRTFHSGRIRLVLITSGRMVVVATGKHQPSIKAG
ncbi:MAG: hypothetical protein M3Q31_20380 [Actinomycetota bacterium]|nr:hypothetical protein [Actinomycetota bacterium]